MVKTTIAIRCLLKYDIDSGISLGGIHNYQGHYVNNLSWGYATTYTRDTMYRETNVVSIGTWLSYAGTIIWFKIKEYVGLYSTHISNALTFISWDYATTYTRDGIVLYKTTVATSPIIQYGNI